MISTITTRFALSSTRQACLLRMLFAGLLLPFGFAPFHFPGLAILGVGLLYAELQHKSLKQAVFIGFTFGLGFMSLGVSWIYVSIHAYGHLNALLSGLITSVFIAYLALFTAFIAVLYNLISNSTLRFYIPFKSRPLVALLSNTPEQAKSHAQQTLGSCFLFSALWCIGEFLRSTCFTGFPWLLLGFSQIDTPLRSLLPIIGVYGVGFIACFAATCLINAIQINRYKIKLMWLTAFVGLLLIPGYLSNVPWTTIKPKTLSVGVIQANLSMRDKWDETLFWQLLERYQHGIDALIGKKQIIVMPESAIPIPATYVHEFLTDIDQRAKRANSTLIFGIPKATSPTEMNYYNTVSTLGFGHGSYLKQHLVPFGEFIPKPFQAIMSWLQLPVEAMQAGGAHQPLITAQGYPIAALICYELAYPELLRRQLPQANWIVSISDDGWFGHSLAMYQQLQMAQTLSLQVGRYQIVSNNDGLSAIIDNTGHITDSLPAFSSSLLEGIIHPATGTSPWVRWGDRPIVYLSFIIALIAFFKKRRYPYQSTQL